MKNDKKILAGLGGVMENFEAIRWNISSSINLLFQKSDRYMEYLSIKLILSVITVVLEIGKC